MITREDIERALLTFPPTLTGKEVRRLFGELLKERDGLRRELRFEQEGSSLYVKKISELLNKIERLEQKR